MKQTAMWIQLTSTYTLHSSSGGIFDASSTSTDWSSPAAAHSLAYSICPLISAISHKKVQDMVEKHAPTPFGVRIALV